MPVGILLFIAKIANVLILPLFLLMVVFNILPLQSRDLWWHLASGRWMVETWTIPHGDVFSYTCAGQAWVNTYWLQDVLQFLLYKVGGLNGLIVIKSVFVAGLATVVGQWGLRERPFEQRLLATIWIFLAACPRGFGWSEQASLATLLMLGVLFFVLHRHAYSLHRVSIPRAMVFFTLWANIHRGFLIGLILLGFCAVSTGIRRRQESWGDAKLLVLCVLATLLNPWGWRVYQLIFLDWHLSPVNIAGWHSTPWPHLELFWITWGLTLLTLVFRARSFTLTELPPLLITLFLGWNAYRYVAQVPFFMIWAVPFLVRQWPLTRAGVWSLRVALVAGLLFAWPQFHPRWGVNERVFPVQACDFIERHNVSGRFFHPYGIGGYWMWRFGPERPVFIDGRYPAVAGYIPLYEEMNGAMSGTPKNWQAFLNRFDVDGALVEYPDGAPMAFPFEQYFDRRLWALVYWDDTAIIFLRRGPRHAGAIRSLEFTTVHPDANLSAVLERWKTLTPSVRKQWQDDVRRNARLHPQSLRTQRLLQAVAPSDHF